MFKVFLELAFKLSEFTFLNWLCSHFSYFLFDLFKSGFSLIGEALLLVRGILDQAIKKSIVISSLLIVSLLFVFHVAFYPV